MDLQRLEEKYNDFMNSKHYQQADVSPKYFKKNADLSRLAIMADNMVCNMLFLKNYFELARPSDEETQIASNYVILANGVEIILNVNEAPNFRDKEDYLDWFYSKLNTP